MGSNLLIPHVSIEIEQLLKKESLKFVLVGSGLSHLNKYPNTENPISKPFAPAYFFLGIGSEYSRKDFIEFIFTINL